MFGQVFPLAAKNAQVPRPRKVTLRISVVQHKLSFFFEGSLSCSFLYVSKHCWKCFQLQLSVRQQTNLPGNQFQKQPALLFPLSALAKLENTVSVIYKFLTSSSRWRQNNQRNLLRSDWEMQ